MIPQPVGQQVVLQLQLHPFDLFRRRADTRKGHFTFLEDVQRALLDRAADGGHEAEVDEFEVLALGERDGDGMGSSVVSVSGRGGR